MARTTITPSPDKLLTATVYAARKARTTHPEGATDKGGRWYPSEREDADGDGSQARSPSAAWPWSYMLHCRTRAHCAVLVARALAGLDVPADVQRAVRAHLDAPAPTAVAP